MKKILLYTLLCISYGTAHATVLVQGNGNPIGTPATGSATAVPPRSFDQGVTAKVFDRANGALYVGLNSGSAQWAVSRATRSFGNTIPKFTAIGSNSILSSQSIRFLALATGECDDTPNIAGATAGTTTLPSLGARSTEVFLMTNDGTVVSKTPSSLRDANTTLDEDGIFTTDIVALAANRPFIFAAVRKGTAITAGDSGAAIPTTNAASGIAVVCIDQETLALRQAAAVAGDSGVKAKLLNGTIPQVKIGGDNATIIDDLINPDIDQFGGTQLHWDDKLQRLYIGLEMTTGDDGGKSVVVARVSKEGVLTFENIAPDAAPDAAFSANDVNIVGTTLGNTDITVKNVRTLHASTGPSYLIVNGGVGAPDEVGNQVYALPLVDKKHDESIHGTLAQPSSTLSNCKFVVPAAVNADLVTTNTPAAVVGACPLPIRDETCISDIEVVGDTVYVSIDGTQSTSNETGVFYSQAVFDETGKILRWTPWTKRALVFDAFPHSCPRGRVKFFAVDAGNGKIWAVEAGEPGSNESTGDGKVVVVTQWDRGPDQQSLPAKLNETCKCTGIFSVLDLDQSTRGFLLEQDIIHRYAVFGGASKVIFARVSEALNNPPNKQSPQTIICDFCNPKNFLVTQLPDCAGCVSSLEYSRGEAFDDDNKGYFFAGTEKGLFVFTQPTSGFSVQNLGFLNQAPFSTGGWRSVENIEGSVVDLKTSGRKLYIVTFETTAQTPLKSRVYAVDFQTSVPAMFAMGNIDLIAESGEGVLASSHIFTGIHILPTGDSDNPKDKEQLILATSQGLFRSNADQAANNGIIDATNQTEAMWQLVANPDTVFSDVFGLDQQDISPPSTIWPVSVQDTKKCPRTMCRSSVHQLSGQGSEDGTSVLINGFKPRNFNNIESKQEFECLDPITYFWSDGARRFFVVKRKDNKDCTTDLMVLPFDTKVWHVDDPGLQIVGDPTVSSVQTINWIKEIGATGIVLAGTDDGVIALE